MDRKWNFWGLIFFSAFSPLVWAIDCTNPASGVERTICIDRNLQKNFLIIERVVQKISRRDPRILWSQKAWLDRLRHDCAANRRWCIQSHLQQRTTELSTRMSAAQSSPLQPLSRQKRQNATDSVQSTTPTSIPQRIGPARPSAIVTHTPSSISAPAGRITVPPPGPPPIIDGKITWQLRNADYTISGKVYHLRYGRYHNQAEWAYLDFGRVLAAGDYDGDGRNEYLVTVYFNGGGSGVFPQLYLVSFSNGRPAASLPFEIPDRSDIRGAAIGQGIVTLSTVEPGPHDPACCPSKRVFHRLVLRDRKLVELR